MLKNCVWSINGLKLSVFFLSTGYKKRENMSKRISATIIFNVNWMITMDHCSDIAQEIHFIEFMLQWYM